MSFNINEFLEEYGTQFADDGSFRGEVLPMKMQSGFGVFAGRDSKFFPVMAKPLIKKAKESAEVYASGLSQAKVYACVQQAWYSEMLGREKQPAWTDGKWEEMKRRTVIQVNGEWQETGDWLVFSSQWMGDNPPVKNEDFGKKLWVHQGWERHPDFDEENPTKYTAQMQDGEFVLDDSGKPRPQYLRVVREVLGEDKAVAEAWYAEHKAGEGETAVSDSESTVEAKLAEIRKQVAESDDELVNECLTAIYDSCTNGQVVDDAFVEQWASVGIEKPVLEAVNELAKQYGAF